ncbi:MAG: hypothetical protein DRP64_09945, partial [Verrucomicrobia bacterium]
MKKYIGMFIVVAGICGSVMGEVVATATFSWAADAVEGVAGDLFDGATVTANSPLHPVSTTTEDWFSAPNTTELLFDDPPGTKFIEFNTADEVVLRSVVASLGGDTLVRHVDARSIDGIKFYAGTSAETVMGNLVADVAVNADYTGKYGSPHIQVAMDFNSVTGQYFRLEFSQPLNGARIKEIDGYDEPYVGSSSGAVLMVLDQNVYSELPLIPELIFGVNQFGVGKPDSEGRHWPLTDDEAEWFKT